MRGFAVQRTPLIARMKAQKRKTNRKEKRDMKKNADRKEPRDGKVFASAP